MEAGRAFATRTPSLSHLNSVVAATGHYATGPEIPSLGANGEMLATYRPGATYSYGGKSYYAGVAAGWSEGGGGVEYPIEYSQYPLVSHHDTSHGLPYPQHWSSSRSKHSSASGSSSSAAASMYVDADSAYTAYGGNTTLVHRPAAPASEAHNNFSFSSMSASLPSAGPDRLLPTPTVSRSVGGAALASSGYRGGDALAAYATVTPAKSTDSASSVSSQSTASSSVTEVAAAGYAASFYGSGHHHGRSSQASSSGGAYATGSGEESIFGEEAQIAGRQGSAVDLSGYTYGSSTSGGLRRSPSGSVLVSRLSSSTEMGGSSSGHGYLSPESTHGAHHSPRNGGSSASDGYSGDVASSSSAGGRSSSTSHRPSAISSRR
jgi:hypothetical protein